MEKYRYYKYEIFSCTDNDAQVQSCGSALSQTSTPKWKEDRRRGGKEQKLCECGTSELCSSALSNLQRDQPTDEEEEDESTVIFYYFSFEVTIVGTESVFVSSFGFRNHWCNTALWRCFVWLNTWTSESSPPCLLGAFVLCSCSSWPAVPAWSLNAHFTARTQRGCKCDAEQPNFHHVTFSHPKSATHTHSHKLTQTHTQYVGTLLGCVGGEAVDGRVTQLGWQLSSGLGSALRHRLHVLMVLAGHTHPPTYTHTQSDVQQPCLILLLAADYTPTCWMGGEGLRMWGGEGGVLGQPLRTHIQTHTGLMSAGCEKWRLTTRCD